MRDTPGLRRLRRTAGAACLAGCVLWSGLSALRFAAEFPRGGQLAHYAYMGEILTHGIRDRADAVSYRMPLGTLAAARLQYHTARPPALSMALYQALAVALLFVLGGLLHPLGAFIAAAAAVVLMPSHHDYTLYPESGYYLLVLLTACLLAWRARAPSPARSALLALGLGATLLYRAPLFLFGPVLALYEWGAFHRFSLRTYWRHLLILFVVPYLLLIPWMSMNWSIHHRLILFEKDAATSNIVTGALGLVQNIEGDLGTLIDAPLDRERPGAVAAWAAGQIAAHPLRFARAFLLRVQFALSPHPLLAVFALLSAWIFRKRREFSALGLLAAYFLGVHCLMTVEPRYFFPLWPLLAILACALIGGFSAQAQPDEQALDYRLSASAVHAALVFVLVLCLMTGHVVVSYGALARSGPPEAGADLDRALAAFPRDPWLLQERGRARLAQGRLAGALEDLTLAVSVETHDPASRLRLAWAQALTGKPGALLGWRTPPDAGIDSPQLALDAEILKACAYIHLGRPGEAAAPLQVALELFSARNILVRGPHGERERAVLDRLRSSDTGFASHCAELQGDRPVAERRALNAALAKVLPASSTVWIERAELAARSGERAAALAALAKAEGLKPDERAQLRMATLYVSLKNGRRGLALLEERARRAPGLALHRVEWAESAAQAGNRANALKAVREAEGLRPSEEERRRLAVVYRELGEYRLARTITAGLTRNRPHDAALWLEHASLEARVGERDEALQAAARAEGLRLDAEQRRRLADVYRELKDYRRARDLFDALARERPQDPGLHLEAADAAARLGEKDTALKSAAKAEVLSLSLEQRRRLAGTYRELKDYRRALTLYEALARDRPQDAELWIEHAELAARLGERDKALTAAARAEALSLDEEQRRRVAGVYRELKDYGRALTLYDALARSRPENVELLLEQADVTARLGRRDEALKILLRAQSLAPTSGQWHGLALAYQALNACDRAVVILDRLIKQNPAGAEFHSDRGLCRHLMGSSADAISDLQTAIRLKPAFLSSYLTLGAIRAGRGEFEEAVRIYDSALAHAEPGPDSLHGIVLAARRDAQAKIAGEKKVILTP